MRKFKHFLLIASVLILATSCFDDPELKGVSNFKMDSINREKISFNIDVSTYNPNNYKIKVRKSTFSLYLNDSYIGEAQLLEKYKMHKRTTTLENVPVEVFLEKDMFFELAKIAVGRTVDLRLEGVLKSTVAGLPVRTKINQTKNINLKDLNINFGSLLGL